MSYEKFPAFFRPTTTATTMIIANSQRSFFNKFYLHFIRLGQSCLRLGIFVVASGKQVNEREVSAIN